MMEFCGQLIMFDNGAFQEKKAVFMLITLCGLCPVLLASIICLAGPNIGLISGVVLIFVFCIASFNMFPRKVSLHRYIVSLGVLFMSTHALTYFYNELFRLDSVLLDLCVHHHQQTVVSPDHLTIGVLLHC